MSFLDRIRACSRFDPSGYRPFQADGHTVGFVKPDLAELLRRFPGVFSVTADAVILVADERGPTARTARVEEVLRDLFEQGIVTGWRDEPYPVLDANGRTVLFTMERGAVPLFGIRASGVHLNGIVRDGSDIRMWVGRRSLDKAMAPGKLDQLVAGGQAAGSSVWETLIKEAGEEAAIPEAVAKQSVPTGLISYCTEAAGGLRRDTLYVFDLEVPKDFEPRNTDGELSEFYLWPIEKVAHIVERSDEFKFNCSLVVIDFLIRHGLLRPDHPDYSALCRGLRSDHT